MNYFNNDPKQAQKKFFKHFWDFSDETSKHTKDTYVNQEAEMWKSDIQHKAELALMKQSEQEIIDL